MLTRYPGPSVTTAVETLDRDEVLERVVRIATRIRRDGAQRVATLGHNSGQLLIVQLAITLAGAQLAPLSAQLRPAELARLVSSASIDLLFVDAGHARAASEAVGVDPRPADLVLLDGPPQLGIPTLESWTLGGGEGLDLRTVHVQAPLMFTSGTTGTPRMVQLPRRTFPGGTPVGEYLAWASRLRLAPHGRHIVSGPLYHTGPLQAVGLLANGNHVFVPDRFDAGAHLDWIIEHEINTSVMVPTHFVRLLAARDVAGVVREVSSMKYVLQTGSSCPVEVKQAMIRWWGPVFEEVYGGTESGILTSISSSDWQDHAGSVGRPVPGITVHVVDDAGADLPVGETGRLFFEQESGEGISYVGDDTGADAQHLRPGVFTLGEIGHVDVDGYVYITDRHKDMVVSGGVNLFPAEAEAVLLQHPAVVDVAVIGVPDGEMGERMRALVVSTEAASVSEADLVTFCREHLSAIKCPRDVVFVQSLQRTDMGKVRKKDLRELFGGVSVPTPVEEEAG